MDVQPPMGTPFTRWLEAAMTARGIGVRQLAKYAKMSASNVSSLLKGENEPSLPTLRKLAPYFHLDLNELVALLPSEVYTGTVPSSIFISDALGVVLVPVMEQEAGAGRGVGVLEYEFVSPAVTSKHNVIAVRIKGDCMAPKIEDGDTVIVDREIGWENGRIILARVDDQLLIKRAYHEDGHIRLHCENPAYPDTTPTDADVLGVVIRVIKQV